jgi:hypothetical protein
MINLQQRLETLTEKAANLVAQVDELNKLRDKIRRAQLSIPACPHRPSRHLRMANTAIRIPAPNRAARNKTVSALIRIADRKMKRAAIDAEAATIAGIRGFRRYVFGVLKCS